MKMTLPKILCLTTLLCTSMAYAVASESQQAIFPDAAKVENSDKPTNTAESEGEHELEPDFLTRGFPDPRSAPTNEKVAFTTPFGQVDWLQIVDKMQVKDGRYVVDYNGFNLHLSLDPALQASLGRQLQLQRNVSGTIVILDPKTGRLLAMVERRGEQPVPLLNDKSSLVAARAPAASLLKIITATAAIEKTGLAPDEDIFFNGGCGKLRHQNWLKQPKRDRQRLSFARAFGVSCNTAFARLGIYWTGLAALHDYSERYMMNKPIPSDLKFETSAVLGPKLEEASAFDVAEFAAGFTGSKLSPIHSAMLSAVTANDGVMMAPYIVDAAFNKKGEQVYTGKPREISRVFQKSTTEKMLSLMHATITSGTSRRYFARRGTRKERFEIGGKTGTLSDAEMRSTLYTWFSGLTQLDTPNVAISTLIASPQNWVVRASMVAQQSIANYIQLQKMDKRFASSKPN